MLHALLFKRRIYEKDSHGPIWTSMAEKINR